MQSQPTRTPRKPQPSRAGLGPLQCFVALCAAVLIGCLALWPTWESDAAQPHGSVDAADGDPYFVTPEPTPEVVGDGGRLRLELALPPLSDAQLYYQRAALVIPTCPLCYGIDKPPVGLTDDQLAVFVALLYTESHLQPFDEAGNLKASEAGCIGIAQLCGDLLTFDTRDNQLLAIWTAADYFASLLADTDGDYIEALRRYKGITSADTTWQADTIFGFIRLRGGK